MIAPQPADSVRVVLVTKSDLVEKEVNTVLEAEREFELMDMSYLEEGVLGAVQTLQPDIILYDYNYGTLEETFDTIDDLTMLHPESAVVVILPEEAAAQANQVILAGARAFIFYPFTQLNLLSTLRRVRELHTRIVSPQIAASAAAAGNNRTFVVFSPKGGVGCTTVAINLAIAMFQERGEEVLLMDGKHMFGDVGLMLNLRTANSILDLIPHAGSVDENLLRQVIIRHTSGIQVLPGPFSANVAQAVRPDDLYNVTLGMQRIFPNVVIDGGSHLGEDVVTLMDAAHRVLLVITPDLASLRGARLFMDICRTLSYPREKILLVLNKVGGRNDVSAGEVEKVLHTKVFSAIPSDENLALSSLNEGVPLILKRQGHPISKAVKKMARGLLEMSLPQVTRLHSEPASDVLLRTSRLG